MVVRLERKMNAQPRTRFAEDVFLASCEKSRKKSLRVNPRRECRLERGSPGGYGKVNLNLRNKQHPLRSVNVVAYPEAENSLPKGNGAINDSPIQVEWSGRVGCWHGWGPDPG